MEVLSMKETVFAFTPEENLQVVTFPASRKTGMARTNADPSQSITAGEIEVETYAVDKVFADQHFVQYGAQSDDAVSFIYAPLVAREVDRNILCREIEKALFLFDTIEEDEIEAVAAKLVDFECGRDIVFVILDESGIADTPAWSRIFSAMVKASIDGMYTDPKIVLVTRDRRVSNVQWSDCDVIYI